MRVTNLLRFGRRSRPVAIGARGATNRRVDRDQRQARRRAYERTAKLATIASVLALAGYQGVRLADGQGWLSPFRVREVRVVGNQVTHPAVLVAEAGLMGEELHYWSPLAEYAERLERDPLVAQARVRRRFPNRLRLEIVERRPIALLALDRLAPVDSTGRVLPVSAFQPGWNVPVVTTEWPAAVVTTDGFVRHPAVRALIGRLREIERHFPALAREISAIELDRAGTVTLRLVHADGAIVADLRTPIEKLALIDDVLRDLRQRGHTYLQLDLRFEDQIVVRRS